MLRRFGCGKPALALLSVTLCATCAVPDSSDTRELALASQAIEFDDSCDDQQRERINSAVSEVILLGAFDIMPSLNQVDSDEDAAARVDRWFGGHDTEIVSRVRNTFGAMYGFVSSTKFTCDCTGVPESVIARATQHHPEEPILLCKPFFERDFTEFAVGALVHELSHQASTGDGDETGVEGWCVRGDPNGWPDTWHEAAVAAAEAAKPFGIPPATVRTAELYRLYALDWPLGKKSSHPLGCK